MVDYAFDLNEASEPMETLRPFLRWAGGKRRLLPRILGLMPQRASHYIEPFFGGGALFFHLGPVGRLSVVSDSNGELINCYRCVQSSPEEVIGPLSKLKYSKREYYKIRASEPSEKIDRAVRFIYLNRTCWNGLYRVSKDGVFNVPIGRFTGTPVVCDADLIRSASERLAGVKILDSDFEDVVDLAVRGDFVYLDPPYITKVGNNGFREYNETVFAWSDQERLAKAALKLKRRKVNVMISNSANEYVQELFSEFNVWKFSRSSAISGTRAGRGPVNEVIITSYRPSGTLDGFVN